MSRGKQTEPDTAASRWKSCLFWFCVPSDIVSAFGPATTSVMPVSDRLVPDRTRKVIGGMKIGLFIGLDQQFVHEHNIRLWQPATGWLNAESFGDMIVFKDQHLSRPSWYPVGSPHMPDAGKIQVTGDT